MYMTKSFFLLYKNIKSRAKFITFRKKLFQIDPRAYKTLL